MKVKTAKTNVTAIFPVRFAPPGKKGNRPIMFERNIKQKAVKR